MTIPVKNDFVEYIRPRKVSSLADRSGDERKRMDATAEGLHEPSTAYSRSVAEYIGHVALIRKS